MKPQRRQRDEDDDESSSSPLQNSASVEELIAALQQIIARNDSCDRSEENVSIILNSKIQLIVSNRTNQDLLQALGEFFMWMMPYTGSLTGAEREAEAEERERGQKICSCKELEELFVHYLLPFAKSSDAILSLCRSVCRVTFKSAFNYFVTADARDELLKLVKNAPCEKSLQWALQAIYYLAMAKKDGVPIGSNPFVRDEVSAVAHKLFCESSVPKIVKVAAQLLTIQVKHSTPQFFATDPDFDQKMLRKLDEATEAETISSIAFLIDLVVSKEQGGRDFFSSGEAAHVFLSKLTSSEDRRVLQRVCLCIHNVAVTSENISDDFASPEMCRAIFKCFSKQQDEAVKDILRSIAALTYFLPRARSTFVQECPGLTQAIIEMLTTATDDDTRRSVAAVVANVSLDVESAKLVFNHVPLYDSLIHAVSRVRDEETRNLLQNAMHNATVTCTDFLPLCAARYPFYDERQIELLKLDSLESLVSDLENRGWVFDAPGSADFLILRSILIVLEKCDQFLEVVDQRIEQGDARIEEVLMTIGEGFDVLVQSYSAPFLGDAFVDVVLSLIERSSGAANAIFVNIIYIIEMWNPLVAIYPSTMLRLLQKLDNSKELRDREYNGLKMEFNIYEILETAAIRNPELLRGSNFLVENSALIRSCFKLSFEIHELDTNSSDRSLLKTHVEALYKIDPRMKDKMEGWDRPRQSVA